MSIQNYLFTPRTLKIKINTKVIWTNNDTVGHNVEFTAFGSKHTLPTGKTWSHKFTADGTFSYRCTLHPQMVGKVVVSG